METDDRGALVVTFRINLLVNRAPTRRPMRPRWAADLMPELYGPKRIKEWALCIQRHGGIG